MMIENTTAIGIFVIGIFVGFILASVCYEKAKWKREKEENLDFIKRKRWRR